MATTEHTINDALAEVLRQTRCSWRASSIVSSENTGTLKGSSRRPDILITEPYVSPVVIETEVVPATTVESEAVSRLGEQVRTTGRMILSSIAVRLPAVLRTHHGVALQDALREANDIEMALYTGTNLAASSRWPRSGWIRGNISDLSILAQSASVPPDVIEEAASVLVDGVKDASGLLDEIAKSHAGALRRIGKELRQEDGEQTRRMAMTILANAFVFHENLAGDPGDLADIRSIEELRGSDAGLSKAAILSEWRKILQVNYWPIFDVARRILEIIPTASSKAIIERVAETAGRLVENRLTRSHDLTGAVFQRLIADRKFLAAYYTTPAAAAFLVGLAVTTEAPPAQGSWSSADDLGKMRVADFACGTGTLLSTAYQRMGQLHELAGGDAEALHPVMMATGLVGCDVLPAAAHLTASMLAGAHPARKYERSSILTVAYGKQDDGHIALGSLDLLDPQGRLEFLAITAKAAEGMGETEKETWASLPHASFDLVIMNPPFTRPTGQEAKKIGVPNPMFAAFGSTEEEQRLMAKATERLTKGTSAHGNAGEASIFLVLGNRKLKPGGVLALVMPLSLMAGDAWEESRALLAGDYTDLVVVSIAGPKDFDVSFSADTGSGECLVVGRKVAGRRVAGRKAARSSRRATFVSLNERPGDPIVGAAAAQQVRRLVEGGGLTRLEDGPVGGTPLYFGKDAIGQALDAPLPESGGWLLSRIVDLSLAQTAYQIATKGIVWLPAMPQTAARAIPMTTVGKVAKVGPYHADINGTTQGGGIRGPFSITDVSPSTAPTYPVLWSHDADRERTMNFEADSEGVTRKGKNPQERAIINKKAKDIWATASHCHLNRDFRFNSQSTSMQFTTRRTIGGRAWPSICLGPADQEKVLVLWGNTTLGLLMYWWHSNKQQTGRGSIGVEAAETLPVLNVKELPAKRLARAVELFDLMCARELLPLNEIDKDPVRRELDTMFARDILGLQESILAPGGPLELLRMKLAREPSIHRGKKSRVGSRTGGWEQ